MVPPLHPPIPLNVLFVCRAKTKLRLFFVVCGTTFLYGTRGRYHKVKIAFTPIVLLNSKQLGSGGPRLAMNKVI